MERIQGKSNLPGTGWGDLEVGVVEVEVVEEGPGLGAGGGGVTGRGLIVQGVVWWGVRIGPEANHQLVNVRGDLKEILGTVWGFFRNF